MSPSERRFTRNLHNLVEHYQVRLLGSVRQEVLSGIREESQFTRVRDHLRGYTDVQLDTRDYEEAARASSLCRRSGVASSSVDCLLCAVALRHQWQIFTTDRDFILYAKVLPLQLFQPS